MRKKPLKGDCCDENQLNGSKATLISPFRQQHGKERSVKYGSQKVTKSSASHRHCRLLLQGKAMLLLLMFAVAVNIVGVDNGDHGG